MLVTIISSLQKTFLVSNSFPWNFTHPSDTPLHPILFSITLPQKIGCKVEFVTIYYSPQGLCCDELWYLCWSFLLLSLGLFVTQTSPLPLLLGKGCSLTLESLMFSGLVIPHRLLPAARSSQAQSSQSLKIYRK